MKFRDPQQMMEIARLKLLISEMREKEAGLQARLLAAHAENPDGRKLPNNSGQQEFMKKRLAALDEQIRHMSTQIDDLQYLVDVLHNEIAEKNNMVKELALAKATIKELQAEIGDDVKVTKSKLMYVKQQLSDLERTEKMNMQKEEDYKKISETLLNMEEEVTGLKLGNNRLLLQNEALRQKIAEAQQRAEKMATDTMDSAISEVSKLRSTNYDLKKMVEYLQTSRFNEVEELVYLRWVNACLRHDVDVCKASRNEASNLSDLSSNECGLQTSQQSKDEYKDIVTHAPTSFSERDGTYIHSVKSHLESSQNLSRRRNFSFDSRLQTPMNQTQKKLHNEQRRSLMVSTDIFSGSSVTTNNSVKEKLQRKYSMTSDMFPVDNSKFSRLPSLDERLGTINFEKENCKSSPPLLDKQWSESEISPLSLIRYEADYAIDDTLPISMDQNNDLGRVASAFKILSKSPKMGSSVPAFKTNSSQQDHKEERLLNTGEQLMLEWYRSSPDDTSLQVVAMSDALTKRSQTHKSSAQNDFVQDLAQSVRVAKYRYIEDVVAFIEWLDRQVDNEDFVNCEDWPTKRVNAMRWEVREFQKLKQLESEIGYFMDASEGPPDFIMKEMLNVQRKAGKYIQDITQARDQIAEQLQVLNLPTDWMFDSGIVAKVKLGSDQLFQKCLRIAQELQ